MIDKEANSTLKAPATGNGSPTPVAGLPGNYYWSRQQFGKDLARVFYPNWLFAAHGSQIPNPGDYITFSLGRDSIILLRDETGAVRAHFNSCRHRGSLICDESSGHAPKLVCPYHQWVYNLDGRLAQCRWMGDDFDKTKYRLHQAHVEVVHDFIFVCLAPIAPNFEPARKVLSHFIARHAESRVKVCLELDYSVKANWKTIFDNNRECYHCAVGHREFCRANFDLGMLGDPRSSPEFNAAYERISKKWTQLSLDSTPVNFPDGQWFRLMRFPLKDGFVTESLDGAPVGPVIGRFQDHDIGSLRIVGLPNMWFHLNSDYFMTTRLLPVSARKTHAKVVWYVREDAIQGKDFDPARVGEVWRITSEQDWKLCEMNQRGLESTRYVPGPLSPIAEQGVSHFASWYREQLVKKPSTGWQERDVDNHFGTSDW